MTEPALADACALIVFLGQGTRGLSPVAVAALRAPALVSPVTVWEVSLKMALKRLPRLPLAVGGLGRALHIQGFRCHPLTWADAERANALPPLHKDPMDRMLIAQALNAGLPVITQDPLFAAYGVTTIW